MKSAPSPNFTIRAGLPTQETSLLDKLMTRGQQNLLDQGINLPKPGEQNQLHWDHADGLYQTIGMNMIQIGRGINETVKDIRAAGLPNIEELNLAVHVVAKDIEKFSIDLRAIYDRHKDMSGPITEPAAHTLYLSVGQDYTFLADQLKANIFNNMITIEEFGNQAMAKLRKEAAAADLTNPDVISDVEVKEVKTEDSPEQTQ